MKAKVSVIAVGLVFLSGTAMGIPNPAAKFCVEALNGAIEMQESDKGQVGFCKFKLANGHEYLIEEWELFRFFQSRLDEK